MTRNCPPVLLSFIHCPIYFLLLLLYRKQNTVVPTTFGHGNAPKRQALSDSKAKLVKSTTTLHNITTLKYKEKTDNQFGNTALLIHNFTIGVILE